MIIVKDMNGKVTKASLWGGEIGVSWGAISGNLSDQTDLQEILNNKIEGDGVRKITSSNDAPENPEQGDIWIKPI